MDDAQVDIQAIKKLKMIHFYHVVKDGDVLAAAMAHYDSDKVMNLCVLDKHYDEFIAKLFMVYEAEPDKDDIIVDGYSKAILGRAVSADIGYYDEYLKQLTELEQPLYYHQSYMPYVVVPIVKYLIKELYGITGKKIEWNNIENTWFGRGTLRATASDGEETFPLVLTAKAVGKYEIRVGNFFDLKHMLEIKLDFDYKGIKINAVSEGAGVDAKVEYLINTDARRVISDSQISLNGKVVYSNNEPVDGCNRWADNSKLDAITEFAEANTTYFKLPWGQYLVLENVKDVGEATLVEKVRVGYITKTDERNNGLVISYDAISSIEGKAKYSIFNYAADIFEEKIYGEELQVYFDSLGFNSRGYYKTKMADRYFKMQ